MCLILCTTHHQHPEEDFLTLSDTKFWILYFSLFFFFFFFNLTEPANSSRENLMPDFGRTPPSFPFFVDTQHLLQIPCSTKNNFFCPSIPFVSFTTSLSDFFQFWKTILGITVVVEWLREFFFWKNSGDRVCNAASHPGDVEIRITSSCSLSCTKASCNEYNSTLKPSTKLFSLVILWASSGWNSCTGNVVLLQCGQREMTWMSTLLCHTGTIHVCAGKNTLQFEASWPSERLQ